MTACGASANSAPQEASATSAQARPADVQACGAVTRYGAEVIYVLTNSPGNAENLLTDLREYLTSDGTSNGPMSTNLQPRAQLVDSEAQILLSQLQSGTALDDPSRLKGYLSDMAQQCKALGVPGS